MLTATTPLALQMARSCPVYATKETWALIERFPIANRHTVEPRHPFRIGTISFEAFSVEHSLRAPAVGYRITAGTHSVLLRA